MKMDGWKMIVSFWDGATWKVRFVSFKECNYFICHHSDDLLLEKPYQVVVVQHPFVKIVGLSHFLGHPPTCVTQKCRTLQPPLEDGEVESKFEHQQPSKESINPPAFFFLFFFQDLWQQLGLRETLKSILFGWFLRKIGPTPIL